MAQGTSGKDFWVAFLDADFYCESRTPPPPTKPGPWDEDTLELYITSKYAATVIVGVNPLSMTDFADTFKLVPYQIHHVQLPSNIACRDFFSDKESEFGVHVTSDSNINVQAVNRFWSSKGSTTVLPSESIPMSPEYFVTTNASPNQWGCWVPYGQKPIKSAEFVIVGISDFSVIEVIPTGFSTIYNNKRGIPYEVKLKKGQTFSYNTIDDDLTGSIIRSRDTSSKFAVFAGNRLTYSNTSDSNMIPCVSGSSYNVFQYMVGLDLADLDHTYEQMVPTVSLGLSYTALPFKNSMGGYYLKVVSIEKNTRISVDGKFFRLLEQGEYFVLNVGRDSARHISADKRISVTQFAKGTKCNKHTLPKSTMGDVSQIQLVPDEQVATEANISRVTHTFSTWANSNADYKPENYLNVMVKTGDTSQFRLNSKAVPNALWKKIAVQPGYHLAQIDLDTFNYKLVSPKGFLAYVYGNSAFEGYAYAAAANFKPLRMDFVFNRQCTFDTIKFTALKSDSFINFSWKFGDKSGILSGHTINRIFKDTGWQLIRNRKIANQKAAYQAAFEGDFDVEPAIDSSVASKAAWAARYNAKVGGEAAWLRNTYDYENCVELVPHRPWTPLTNFLSAPITGYSETAWLPVIGGVAGQSITPLAGCEYDIATDFDGTGSTGYTSDPGVLPGQPYGVGMSFIRVRKANPATNSTFSPIGVTIGTETISKVIVTIPATPVKLIDNNWTSTSDAAYSFMTAPASEANRRKFIFAAAYRYRSVSGTQTMIADGPTGNNTQFKLTAGKMNFRFYNNNYFSLTDDTPQDTLAHVDVITGDFTDASGIPTNVAKWARDFAPVSWSGLIDVTGTRSFNPSSIMSLVGLFAESDAGNRGDLELAYIYVDWGDATYVLPDIYDATVFAKFLPETIGSNGSVPTGAAPKIFIPVGASGAGNTDGSTANTPNASGGWINAGSGVDGSAQPLKFTRQGVKTYRNVA